ncbi:hypothetical protein [Duganella aceris]|uniref:hypothetical protein n=1 Tax=Duganella aceris TaxID=2703883 RepID=UPI001407BB67|nr:hypothetical protein [Duganella aceris]
MFTPKPPRSVQDNRPVAVMVVKQEKTGAVDKHMLIVETPTKPPKTPNTPKAK